MNEVVTEVEKKVVGKVRKRAPSRKLYPEAPAITEVVAVSPSVVDKDVTPQYLHRKKVQAKEFAQVGQNPTVDEWYTVRNGKIIKCFKKKNGNSCTAYIGTMKRDWKYLETLKAKGLVRD